MSLETRTHIYSSIVRYDASRLYFSRQFYLLFCPLSPPFHEQVCRLILETPRPCNRRSNSINAESYLSADATAAEGTTPFHWAAWGAHLSTCQLLITRGADHRKVNAYGCNAAHWCGLSGDVEVCRYYRTSDCLEELDIYTLYRLVGKMDKNCLLGGTVNGKWAEIMNHLE